ncbi:MAG: cobalamin-dependent protein [Thermodesulfobacteriota bacterium]
MNRDELCRDIKGAIADWDKERLVNLVIWARESGLPPIEIVSDILLPELLVVCKAHHKFNLSFSELLLMADTIQSALDLLVPEIKAAIREDQGKGTIVIGTVEGDIHDFGKNLVAAVFQSGGFHVIDLGRDVPLEEFISAAERENADVVAVSALMTPALKNMKRLMSMIRDKGVKVKTIIGGLASSPQFAAEIGADTYADDALSGLKKIEALLEKREVQR